MLATAIMALVPADAPLEPTMVTALAALKLPTNDPVVFEQAPPPTTQALDTPRITRRGTIFAPEQSGVGTT
jgi:hypothetical protein